MKTGPLKGQQANGTGYEIHTGITTGENGNSTILAQLSDADTPFPSEVIGAEGPGAGTRENVDPHTRPPEQSVIPRNGGARAASQTFEPKSFDDARLRRDCDERPRANARPELTPDGTIHPHLPVFGSYVHGLFDSPEILRRLLNTTAQTHNLPKPVIQEFSMEAEFDRLAQAVRQSIDMNLINSLISM
jgi:cobyric acid synthase